MNRTWKFAFLWSIGAATLLPTRLWSQETQLVAMSDGVRLSTNVYLPDGKGPWPVELERTPYGKANGDVKNLSASVTADGWVLVIQDTRGRGASEGANVPFEADGWGVKHDGADTIRWIAGQPWCDGHVVTCGASALGIAQLMLAGTGVRPLSAQYIQVAGSSSYAGIYRQGVFRKAMIEGWIQRFKFDPSTLRVWTSHPGYDDYWMQRDLARRYPFADSPAVHEGGWFDIFTQGTLDSFEGYNEDGGPHARGRQRLIMGPWTHMIGSDHAGQLTFPNANAIPAAVGKPLAWFDYTVKGANGGIGNESPVTYYVMGDTTDPRAPGNFWRSAERWPRPEARPTPLFLHADHSAGFAPSSGDAATLPWTSDPDHPVPTIGGPQLPGSVVAPGPMDQAEVEARPDVLVFTSDPLPEPMEVTGRIAAKIWISSDAPDTDVIVRLCIVGANGKSYNLAEGAIRARYWRSLREEHLLEPGKIYPLEIDLWSTSVVFNRGNRIRVDVASTSAPGYEVNPDNGLPLRVPGASRLARNLIHLGPAYPSQIVLPVAPYLAPGAGRPNR